MSETQNWIDALDNQIATSTAIANRRQQADLATSRKIFAEIPGYWTRLLAELKETTRNLSLKPNLHISASVSDNTQPDFEYRARVQVRLIAHRPEIAYTDMNLLLEESVIRCHTLHGDAYKLHFGERRLDGLVGLFSEESSVIMTPEKAAQYILEPMVEEVARFV